MSRRLIALSRLKRKIFKHVWLVRGMIILSLLAGVVLILFLILRSVSRTSFGTNISLAKNFVFTPIDQIDSYMHRTNILILGKGGEGHEAPDLTDTMMFASVDHSDSSVTLISLPRDIWITDMKTKLNSVYYWGNKKQPPVQRTSGPEETGGGIILAKSTVEEILGQPIHYAVILDFSGFKKIIDVLGGVEVEVETTFTDNKYPIAGRENDLCGGRDPEFKCRYETIRFEKGTQFMNGETALKFVRSRNAEGDQGTDFARAKRQQQVIAAIKGKVLSREILFSPKKLMELQEKVSESIETDIPAPAGAILARRFIQSKENITSKVLAEDLLIHPSTSPKYDNLYVFIPKIEDWSEVQTWVQCVLQKGCN